jgi:hypothetical protein
LSADAAARHRAEGGDDRTSSDCQKGSTTLVANKPKVQDRDRRVKIEAMRKAEQAKERRKSMIFVFVAIVVGVGLIGAVAVPSYLAKRNDPANKSVTSFGVALAAASCSSVQTSKGTNTTALRTHVKDGTIEKYATVPPSYGPHWATPIYPSREFYTVRDRPQMERLVHNLEHGYTLVWYDSTIKGDALQQLKDLATSARNSKQAGPGQKFIVSPWDDAYGAFPAGKHIGMSHWGAKDSHVQLCGKVSGAAVQDFMTNYPSTDAPEPNVA